MSKSRRRQQEECLKRAEDYLAAVRVDLRRKAIELGVEQVVEALLKEDIQDTQWPHLVFGEEVVTQWPHLVFAQEEVKKMRALLKKEQIATKQGLADADMAFGTIKLDRADADIPEADGTRIPDFGLKLVPFLVKRKLRNEVAGDLVQDFRTFATDWGRPYALKWLCWELGVLFVLRFAPSSIVAGVVMWFRQKFGV